MMALDQSGQIGRGGNFRGLKAGAADRRQGIVGAVQRENHADAFAVAQRAGQCHHAFDMTITEFAAAVAADQGKTARRDDRLLFDMRIDGAQLRFAFQQQQKIRQHRFAGLGVQPRMHRFNKGQIVWGVDGQTPPFARQGGIGAQRGRWARNQDAA